MIKSVVHWQDHGIDKVPKEAENYLRIYSEKVIAISS